MCRAKCATFIGFFRNPSYRKHLRKMKQRKVLMKRTAGGYTTNVSVVRIPFLLLRSSSAVRAFVNECHYSRQVVLHNVFVVAIE